MSYPGVFTGGKSRSGRAEGGAEEGDRLGAPGNRDTPEGRQGYLQGEEERRRGEGSRWEEE